MAPRILTITRLLAPALALAVCLPASGMAQLSTFTYQGRLRDGGVPVNGSYDLRFILYTLAAGGSQIGVTIYVDDVPIGDGLFATDLDFGAASFPGDVRYLEVAVRPGAVSNADRDPLTYTTLNPRQRLNSTPYAIRARDADTIDGFDSSVFLTGVPNPLSIVSADPGFTINGSNTSSTGTALSGLSTNTSGAGLTRGVWGVAHGPTAIGVTGEAPIGAFYLSPSGVCGTSDIGIGVAGTTTTGTAMVASTFGATGSPRALVANTDAELGKGGVVVNTHATQGTTAELASRVTGAAVEPSMNNIGTAVVAWSPRFAVYGRSDGPYAAIIGESSQWNGVVGVTHVGHGLWGRALDPNGVGVNALGSGSTGTALQIQSGAIKVPNAGIGSATPVFIHRTTAGNISTNVTYIDHPMTDGDPNAILIVTPNWNPGGVGGTYNTNPIGVFYHVASQRWAIFNQNIVAMTVNQSFNVLVVKSGLPTEPQSATSSAHSSRSQPPLVPITSPLEGIRVDLAKSDRK